MSAVLPRVEFRLPISPTRSFYDRVHFFCAALRRLGGYYADALVRITVGGDADQSEIQATNPWSGNYPIEWHRVPDDLFREQGYFGTSDFRYLLPETMADLIILADADTALIKTFGGELEWMLSEEPCIAGHMAHAPPPVKLHHRPNVSANEFWQFLFREFSIPWPDKLYRYSMDLANSLPTVPAYYNLGLLVLNRAALKRFRETTFEVRDRLNAILTSEMRCQIACTLISYQFAMRRQNLSAAFNAANDERHLVHNRIPLDEIRVIHYLRRGELDRESFLGPCPRDRFLAATLRNPVNQLLQRLAREIVDDEWGPSADTSISSANHAQL